MMAAFTQYMHAVHYLKMAEVMYMATETLNKILYKRHQYGDLRAVFTKNFDFG